MLWGQMIYNIQVFGAHRKLLSSYELIQAESDRKVKMWARRGFPLFWGMINNDSKGRKLAFMRYLRFVQPLDKVDEALRCVCLQWETESSAETEHDVREEVVSTDAAVPCE